MKPALILRYAIKTVCILFLFCSDTTAQQPAAEKGLFDSDEVLQLNLKGEIRGLLNDRSGAPKNFPLVLSFSKADNNKLAIPVQVKTRGHFRRLKGNCVYPPLLIQFPKDQYQLSSVFSEQKKLKLVMPCRGDEYVIREWLVYKLYNLVTPISFRARLVKLTLEEGRNTKPANSFYAILLEEEKQMAKRNGLVAVERKLDPKKIQEDPFLTMAVFQYLIGNTDWSVQYLQNIKLLAKDSAAVPVAVPYDFDHAGIVNAPYALPAEQLEMASIRERRYRGYCLHDLQAFEKVIAKYSHLKSDIYGIYLNCSLLDSKYIKTTTRYLDEFYSTINNPKIWQKDFTYPCDENGTGNVIIKGLKED